VLDLTQVVAGPCAGRILVEYGADVIKINSATAGEVPAEFSTSGRPADPGNQQHEHLNRGKRTILLDVASPQAREVFWSLVERADVIMQNFPLGTAQRYGIDYESVRKRKPDIIYFSLSAYGYDGPFGAWRGYEGNAQAATGLMDRFGGDGPPMSQPFLLDDYGTGVRGAFGIALAVYHRLVTGRGQHVMTSLVETASYHQAAYLMDYGGKVWDEPRGPSALGHGPLQRLYKARDAWFFLGAADEDLPRLAEVAGLEGVAELGGAALERGLEERFARQPVAVWLERLRGRSIGAHGLVRMRELMEDPWAKAHGLSVTQEVEGVGRVQMPGVAPRMSRTPLRVGAPVRPPGADLPEVLAEHGLGDRMPELIRAGAVRMSAALLSS
jgi:crotonobetainyl-CoA:carnitine CoA-transferase CaiB-like acyl-CoA transferase